MLVTSAGSNGTIGGGKFEWIAIAEARSLLISTEDRRQFDVPLGPEIGQCCGGHATILIERATSTTLAQLGAAEATERARHSHVLIFGAGFVGRALAAALSPLPFNVRLIDGRSGEFAGFEAAGVRNVVTDSMSLEVDAAPANAAYLIMTHSHSLDAVVAASVLERGDFGYLGIIGSSTKRKRFERAFRQQGLAQSDIDRIHCPIGGSAVRDKRPAVIAALTAAELIAVFGSEIDSRTPGVALASRASDLDAKALRDRKDLR